MRKQDIFHRARCGTLPANFDNWSLTDNLGRTVAHVCAIYGHLPEDFSQWELTSSAGHTVAHIAAINDHLPEEFDRWGMTDGWGVTVREAYDYLRVRTHQNEETKMTDSATDMKIIVAHKVLKAMSRMTAERLTIWHHIENVTLALHALIEAPQCIDDADVYDEIMELVESYDALLRKVTVKQIAKENTKNETL